MTKQRIHNEWFQPLVKKTCPCGQKKTEVFAWGEYHCGKWRTISHFCQSCFPDIQKQLNTHAGSCGCSFELKARSGHGPLPEWIKMLDVCQAA